MKYNNLLMALACIFVCVGFVACSSSSDDEPTTTIPTNPAERKLIIGVEASPWLDENGNARETRGTVTTTETLKDFEMYWNQDADIFSHYTISRGNDSKWYPAPGNWPNDDGSVSFYAYTSGNFVYNGGNRYISFSAEEAAANQHDLLLSKITNVTYSGTGGVIWFTFDHACAALEFNIQITNKLKEKLSGSQLTVDSVRLINIAKTGDCYYSASSGNHIGKWENVCDYTKYTLNTAQFSVTEKPQPLECNTMFVIPQTLGDNAKLEVKYNFPNRADSIAEISLKNIKWEAGHLYPINIVLGTSLVKFKQP